MTTKSITIVSGLPRSGTSMMMRMLQAGGAEILTDEARLADDDNPKGYFELQQVKRIPMGDVGWLRDVGGKVVKIISPFLRYLPDEHRYTIILMKRHMSEILASQRVMLARRGEPADRMDDDKLTDIFEKDMHLVETWMSTRPNVRSLSVSYNELLIEPIPAVRQVARFLESQLDTEAMAAVIEPSLYRQRR